MNGWCVLELTFPFLWRSATTQEKNSAILCHLDISYICMIYVPQQMVGLLWQWTVFLLIVCLWHFVDGMKKGPLAEDLPVLPHNVFFFCACLVKIQVTCPELVLHLASHFKSPVTRQHYMLLVLLLLCPVLHPPKQLMRIDLRCYMLILSVSAAPSVTSLWRFMLVIHC